MIAADTARESARANLAFIRVSVDVLAEGPKLSHIVAHDEHEFIETLRAALAEKPFLAVETASQLLQLCLQLDQHVLAALDFSGPHGIATRGICQSLLDSARAELEPVFHLTRHRFYEAAFFTTNNALHHVIDAVATLEGLLAQQTPDRDRPIGKG